MTTRWIFLGLLSLVLVTTHPWGGPVRTALDGVSGLDQLQALPDLLLGRGDGYALTRTTESGEPVRWHHCGTVPVLVNASDGTTADIVAAVSEVADRTGLDLQVVGDTELVPQLDWPAGVEPVGSYPYPPVVIAETAADETGILHEGDNGAAVTKEAAVGGTRQLVTGTVLLNADELDGFDAGFGPGLSRGNVILHELGHLVGLAHVAGNELMHAYISPRTPDGFTDGDVAGLEAVSVDC